jgi:uncharacterized protein
MLPGYGCSAFLGKLSSERISTSTGTCGRINFMGTFNVQINPLLELPVPAIAEFCRRWRISRLEIFGPALGEDFHPDSDVDFLVTFEPDANWSLFGLVDAEQELARLVGRRADLVERPSVEQSDNWIRRRAILSSARDVYVA